MQDTLSHTSFNVQRAAAMWNIRVCVFGDSIVNGTGDPDFVGWPAYVFRQMPARHAGITLYNMGIRGNTSVQVASRWLQEATARLPETSIGHVIFSFGVNDCVDLDGRRRVELADSLAAAEAILSDAKGRWPTLMIGPSPISDPGINQRIEKLSEALAALCRRLDIPFIETFGSLRDDPLWQTELAERDGAHPGRAGYRMLASLISRSDAWSKAAAAMIAPNEQHPTGAGT
ncbi:GDSL-type esterase/lipase family protein [Ponticoccus alexandrii]|uniref:SGNH hydrolase-type esterase domain-containing protein n=1 Tax=Ponticoccus alexandrii TaxID=1943633 RepID=A0ABX7FJ55_9RHOB|nr:GDSL-type esterase/lipase family protein [Ponticoccus alexandrii]QRF69357.1 hypothetical protein GQA70_23820 [Ponticoccus alexandrii]